MDTAAMVHIYEFCNKPFRTDQRRHVSVHVIEVGKFQKDVSFHHFYTASRIVTSILEKLLTDVIGKP